MAETLIQKSLTQVVLGRYASGASTCIQDPRILPAVQQYKRQVASQLIPVARHDISRRIPDANFFVSRKIDGEYNALIYRNGEMFTLNPGGTVRTGLPFFEQARSQLDQAGFNDVILAGEMHVELGERKRCRVHDAISVLRHPRDEHELGQLRFSVFDLIQVDGDAINQDYSETWQQLKQCFGCDNGVRLVETEQVDSATAVDNLFQKWVETEAAEGIVVRSTTAGNFKIKPLFTIDAVVIGFTESSEDRSGMMHDLLLAVRRKDGGYHVLCRVGGGFTEDQRREMLSDLKDMVVDSEYAEVNSDHVAYQMVRPEWVIEISCLDLVAQNTRGRPVNRMTLKFSEQENAYQVVRRMPLVSVISPQFLRLREDKTIAQEHVRIQQIDDIVPVPMSDVDATELTLPRSKLLQREVYTKTLRGEKLVRKFLLWKTNKETDAENYPAFVAYHADFSPSRKVPLSRDVKVSNSETQILALWHELKEENIKQGWELVTDKNSEIEQLVNKSEQRSEAGASSDSTGENSVEPSAKKKKAAKKATKKKKTAKKKTIKKKPTSQAGTAKKSMARRAKKKSGTQTVADTIATNDSMETDAGREASRKKKKTGKTRKKKS